MGLDLIDGHGAGASLEESALENLPKVPVPSDPPTLEADTMRTQQLLHPTPNSLAVSRDPDRAIRMQSDNGRMDFGTRRGGSTPTHETPVRTPLFLLGVKNK
eukprot:7643676-Alexandrium_andersonii.AAC.1